jgi:hypothetical protein
MQNLDYLIEKYGTDKAISGYSKSYEYLFNDIKNEVTSLLEIGIGSLDANIDSNFRQIIESKYEGLSLDHYRQGGSLRVWRDYFPKAQISGIDIAEDCRFTEDRITTYICDSTDKSACDRQLNTDMFDIIIDDGSHRAEAQLKTFKNFFSRTRFGGLYIIEDLGGGWDENKNMFFEYGEEIKNIIKDHEYWFNTNILVIKKNGSKRGQLESITDFNQDTTDNQLSNQTYSKSNLTVVTGLWNIGRPGRSFDHYLECFDKLLSVDVNMFIFVPKELEDFVWQRRSKANTAIKCFELEDIKSMFGPFWDKTQQIRTSENWLNQAGWLKDSPQGSLEWYNPIVMSKMSLLHDASIYNPFDTDNFVWIDGGITNTINYNLLIQERFFDKIEKYLDPFLFVQYPYPYYGQGVKEVHGFEWDALNRMAGGTVEWICRGGLFGGNKEAIKEVNSYYWHLLNDSLNEGLMGTEESLFSILAEKYPELCRATRIGINGHIQEFVSKALDDTAELEAIPERRAKLQKKIVDVDKLKMSIYMLTFNFPYQVEHTIQTWLKHPKFITNTRNILIDNSTNEEARIENAKLCEKYGFEHIITNENTGINGGRFRAAKHFQESDSDYYLFLEDDMGIHPPEEIGFCRNGFRLCVDNLYDKLLKIMHGGSDVDFLKLSFTEVYMDNNIQVSWYNIPQAVRTEMYPDYDKLPEHGLDPNCPRTVFDKIEFVEGLGYITGDVYYANWPTITGKTGNQKMFLDTTWERPYEQTWMSYMFQETKKGNLKPSVLLASPIHHNRIAHYKPEERREN